MAEFSKMKKLARLLEAKANLKQDIYDNTLNALNMLKKESEFMVKDLRNNMANQKRVIPLEFIDRSAFEFELKFAGDVLVFFMHSNVFDLGPRHEEMRSLYLKKDNDRRYCGIIHIYNFLADSFKYNRMNDSGVLIGRIFINKNNHFFIEGLREMNMICTSFENDKISSTNVRRILMASLLFTINFDLPTPPYELVQEVNLQDFTNTLDQMQMKTGKKMGFRFLSEEKNIL
ncbi:MAG: hypothetical protein GX259_01265 [Bacteroidales bacterium]|jgi:hypothetical protein|nr:hypothetical protein [Bacteroidales bacterium]